MFKLRFVSRLLIISLPAALGLLLLAGLPAGCATGAPKPTVAAPGSGMVRIPGGSMLMGCSPGDADCDQDESPPHRVAVHGFWMDATAVTQAQFERVTGSNPSRFAGCADCPVEMISWNDAQSYCAALGKRLPTEAEWEYAARGGTSAARYGDLDAIAWYKANSGGRTHPVGQKQPNAYGLYDMLGNVWQWCADIYDQRYYWDSPPDNPAGPDWGAYRVLRGGAWAFKPQLVRVSARYAYLPGLRHSYYGFRCVRD
jgi:formylglycine-generating enzyme required for sulfatase activity